MGKRNTFFPNFAAQKLVERDSKVSETTKAAFSIDCKSLTRSEVEKLRR